MVKGETRNSEAKMVKAQGTEGHGFQPSFGVLDRPSRKGGPSSGRLEPMPFSWVVLKELGGEQI